MSKRLIAVALLGIALLLAGCHDEGLDPQEAINGSEAIESVEIVRTEGQFDDEWWLEVTLEDTVRKNDEQCTTTYNPAMGTSTTTCVNNWHDADVTAVTVTEGTWEESFDVRAGERFRLPVTANQNATYVFDIESENAPPSHFQVRVEWNGTGYEMVSAGYGDTY